MHVLFLTPWYPNKWDAMDGIFVRKHAEAVSRLERVSVVYVHSDASVSDFEVTVTELGALTEIRIYYPISSLPLLSSFSKLFNFIRSIEYGISLAEKRGGKIDICQVNVLTRCGVIANWLFRRRGIRYVVLEHWTRYFPENFSYKGFLRRLLTRMVCRDAYYLMTVSDSLAEAMKEQNIVARRWLRIDNVVDDFFYSDADHRASGGRTRLLCVTTFDEPHKNVSGIIRALSVVSRHRSDFILDIIGNGPDIKQVQALVSSLGLQECVNFVGEVMPTMVSKIMHRSDAVVLFSNFETAGVVLSEALAVGLPVITTNVGIAPEFIDEDCGLVVPVKDEVALADALDIMLDAYALYDRDCIRRRGAAFSFKTVGEKLVSVYKQALS